jgi:hypothetical protein
MSTSQERTRKRRRQVLWKFVGRTVGGVQELMEVKVCIDVTAEPGLLLRKAWGGGSRQVPDWGVVVGRLI